MKKYIVTAFGITGILLANSPNVSYSEVNVPLLALGSRPSIYIDSPPTFIYVPELGYSVAAESPYDLLYYDNYYYLYNNGYWYNSSFYDGPWIGIVDERLPLLLREHRIMDIRRLRDIEFSKHDRQYWQYRDLHNRRSQRELRINSNRGFYDGPGTKGSQGRSNYDGINRGERRTPGDGQSGSDNRAPGDVRGGGDGHSSGDGRGGGGSHGR